MARKAQPPQFVTKVGEMSAAIVMKRPAMIALATSVASNRHMNVSKSNMLRAAMGASFQIKMEP
ncbi:hypothetical protein A3D62_02585 [Candidatus Kaiserbacteria bacterium RIFCSPHIGHO2_02_FULL_49_11]|uniref:Uncharacterized protein n=1 Tax=Candidatus Kaiserbacteria bacterium RIFCSPHIGHO2_02_FULL_49_11 TaxID=1798489 RepID=A0A1F6D299_9BACT|nr:MAG: hypothetical protein A3D62_02585 [Candidatus Kaiserbacteria bacterium RIFCSPHIGHO2_02_FULL_49_11]